MNFKRHRFSLKKDYLMVKLEAMVASRDENGQI